MVKLTEKLLCLLLCAAIFCGIAVSSSGSSAKAEEVVSSLSAEELAKMPKYDGRDYGIVTPVKDQGTTNLCWAYSSVAAAEASILKSGIDPTATKDSLSLNPTAVAYRVFRRTADPLGNTGGEQKSGDFTQATGNPLYAAKLFSMWWAPLAGSQASADPYENPSYRFENAYYIPDNRSDPDAYIAAVKEAVATYGAVTFQYNNMRETAYYNPKFEGGGGSSPHACTVVGWDDTIPASRFQPGGATRNGGWLIKNSYNSLEYFWLSYDNTSSSVYAFTFAPKEKYDFNYYYDGNLDDFSLRKDKYVANVFRAQKGGENGKSEYIKAVNVGVSGENVTVEVEVFKNLDYPFGGQSDVPTSGGFSASKKTITSSHGGYLTVELDSPVKVEKDEWFSVIVRVSNPENDAKIVTAYKDVKTLSYANGGYGWSSLGNFVGRIKAYTSLEEDEKTPSTPLCVNGVNVSLNESISLFFAVSDTSEYSDVYMEFSSNGKTLKNRDRMTLKDVECYRYSDISAKQGNDEVTAVLVGTFNGKEYRSEPFSYSVADYCYSRIAKSESAAFKRVCVDLLDYCSAAQIYFNYNTDNLANARLTDEQRKFGSASYEPLTDNSFKESKEEYGIKAFNLVYKDVINVIVAVDAPSTQGLSARVEFDGIVYVIDDFYEVVLNGQRYFAFDFTKIPPNKFKSIFTITLEVFGKPVGVQGAYSIESYLARRMQLSTSTDYRNLMEATAKYGDSCKAYFG